MKKHFALFMFLVIWLTSGAVYADSYSVFGGLKREMTLKKGVYYYEEICFASGKPVLLKGTVSVPEIPKSDNYKLNVKYDVKNIEENISINRAVTYTVKTEKNSETNQVITNWTVAEGGLKESISVKDKTFELSSFQFSNAKISDIKPAIDFSSSNVFYRKTFHTQGALSEEGARLIITGETDTALSYTNYWSNLSSSVMRVKVEYDELHIRDENIKRGPKDQKPDDNRLSWKGSYVLKFSTKSEVSFENVSNDVRLISFKHGLIKNENSEDVLLYSYDMPVFEEVKKDEKKLETGDAPPKLKPSIRNKGEGKLNSYVYVSSKRLPVPKYKDTAGHWAEKNIFKLASLEAFELDSVFFPDVYITRAEFARAVVNSINHIAYEDDEKRRSELIKSKRLGAKPLAYEDVPRDDRYYTYIVKALEDEIMTGEGNAQFLPTKPLTRAEAVTIMMRSIGVLDIAPALPFRTAFVDDATIPDWSKPAFYMADSLGIVKGYKDGSCQALRAVTRAEAASMLSRLIEHLRTEMTLDYRERLLESR